MLSRSVKLKVTNSIPFSDSDVLVPCYLELKAEIVDQGPLQN